MITAIINAMIVLPPEVGGPCLTTLRFDEKQILSLGRLPQRNEHILDLAGKAVYPGLINAHDHLELNHYPRTKFRPVYENAHQWGEDFLPQLDTEPFLSLRRLPLEQQCIIGGLKNLHSGVTTVAHHNPLHKPLRRNFVVRVVQRYGWAHSLHFEPNVLASYRRTPKDAVWMIHLAEGTDALAASELNQLSALGCLQPNTLLIHGVGLTEADRAVAIKAEAGLVWCPSSNLFLLGKTAQVGDFAQAGKLAIGSDSLLTADGNLLDELRAAHATNQLTSDQLFQAVTTNAARLLRLPRHGALLPGYLPDFFISAASSDPYSQLMLIHREEIEAVYISGKPSVNFCIQNNEFTEN